MEELQQKNGRLLATLKLEGTAEFVDPSFYDNLMREKNVSRMDYYHSRVTNNPDYSESLKLEAYSHFHPRFAKFCSLGDVTPGLNPTPTSQVTVLESSSIKLSNPSNDAKLELTLTRLVRVIQGQQASDQLLKVMAWYLVSVNIQFSNPFLDAHMEYFQAVSNLNFNELSVYMGSRFSAEKYRDIFKEVYNTHVLGRE